MGLDAKSRPSRRTGLSQIWFDLTRAHNLEIYVTVLLALTLGLLGIFDVVDPRIVAAATLGTLGLLAVSSLQGRHQSDELLSSVRSLTGVVSAAIHADVPVDRFLATKAPALDDDIRAAMDIRLVGVTLSRTVRDLVGMLDARLRAGAVLRIVIIDPDGTAPVEAVARTLGVSSPDFYRPRVASTLDILTGLASLPGSAGRIEVRLLPYLPAFGMYLFDPDTPDGRVYVELYQHRSLEPNPCFGLRGERDARWYRFFLRQFEVLWDSARPLPPLPAEESAAR
jgi:hypothetical protein